LIPANPFLVPDGPWSTERGPSALRIEVFGMIVVTITVFILSYVTCAVIAKRCGGITTNYRPERVS